MVSAVANGPKTVALYSEKTAEIKTLNIVNKPSSGDLIGMGLPNEVLIGLSYLKLDSILCGIGSGAVDDVIASKSGVQPDVVESVRKAMKRARFAAGLPQVCRRFAAITASTLKKIRTLSRSIQVSDRLFIGIRPWAITWRFLVVTLPAVKEQCHFLGFENSSEVKNPN
jgi:hypothetical protein